MTDVTKYLETLTAQAGSTYVQQGRKSIRLVDAPAPVVARWYADRLREWAAKP